MKTIKVNSLQFIACLILLFSFVSCKKDSNEKIFSPEEFINYSIDGTSHSYVGPSDTLNQHYSLSQESGTFASFLGIGCHGLDGNYIVVAFSDGNIGANSQQPLSLFGTTAIFGSNNVLLGSPNVSITEYGAVGEFIAGNFTGVLIESLNQSFSHNISCSFRVRRIH